MRRNQEFQEFKISKGLKRMACKKIINEVAAKRIMDPVTPLGQILTKGCDEFRMIHSAPSYPHKVSINDGGDPQLVL